MINANTLLKKAENGFNSLEVSKKYVDSVMKRLEIWLTDDTFKDDVRQIRYLIETEQWDVLLDSFYQVTPFGTGGRRGLVGVGPNRIKTNATKSSDHWNAQYLILQYGERDKQGVLKGYKVHSYHEWPYFPFIIAWIKTNATKSSDHWNAQYLILQYGERDKQGVLKGYKVHGYHEWPYFPFIIAWGVNYLILLSLAILDAIGLHFDESLPNLLCMILGGFTLILGKFFFEDLRTDNKIRLMYVKQYLKKMVDQEKENIRENMTN